MSIDQRDQVQAISHRLESSHIPVLVGVDAEGSLRSGKEAMEELIGGSQVKDGNSARFPINATGLHNAPIGTTLDPNPLKASHTLCIQEVV
jgi:hypothetical protein